MFNYQAILASIVTLFTDVYAEKWPVVKEAAVQYVQDAEERLTNVANDYLERGDGEFLKNRLSEEKYLLWGQVRSFEVLAEATAEKLANDAVGIVLDTINTITGKQA